MSRAENSAVEYDNGEEKVQSLLVKEIHQGALRAIYDDIYTHEEVWRRRTFAGYSSLILHLLEDGLEGKQVLDAGCGAGKLALMMARKAQRVEGLDFSGQAIRIARLLAELSHTRNVSFVEQSIEDVPEEPKYDLVTLIGTLEHVIDPVLTLRKLAGVLKPGGLMLLECPGFLNFRGDIYMTLRTLLGLPMSLADIRQVDYQDITEWGRQAGLLLENVCGYAYALGFLEKGVRDMMRRTPLAIRDKGMESAGWDVEQLRGWMEKRLDANRRFAKSLESEGLLQRIPMAAPVALDRSALQGGPPTDVPPRVWEAFGMYLDDNCDEDPYYCTTPPYCHMGGGTIYLLRKSPDF
jgi:ubiquinone biosynthesis O-methyltransferase